MNIQFQAFYDYSLSLLRENLPKTLTEQQQKILMVVSVALGCLATFCIARRCCFKASQLSKNSEEQTSETLKLSSTTNTSSPMTSPNNTPPSSPGSSRSSSPTSPLHIEDETKKFPSKTPSKKSGKTPLPKYRKVVKAVNTPLPVARLGRNSNALPENKTTQKTEIPKTEKEPTEIIIGGTPIPSRPRTLKPQQSFSTASTSVFGTGRTLNRTNLPLEVADKVADKGYFISENESEESMSAEFTGSRFGTTPDIFSPKSLFGDGDCSNLRDSIDSEGITPIKIENVIDND